MKLTTFFTLVFFSVILFFAFALAAEEDSDDKLIRHDYGISIDAGSSGTRVFLYKWKHRSMDVDDNFSPLSHPVTQTDWSHKTKVAISNFANHPEEVSSLLEECTTFALQLLANEKVEPEFFETIPIYLGATAGLRLLNRQQRIGIMTYTRIFLHKSPFLFKDHFAKILSGEEEGFFGYLSVNYLSQTLFPDTPGAPLNTTLLAALDMGGASTQISFAPQPGEDILEHFYSYTSPFNDRYELYTTSFLNYGMNEFYTKLNNLVVNGTADKSTVPNPCYQTGYTAEYVMGDLSFTFQGTGEWAKCLDLVNQSLYLETPCFTDNCSINGVYQPEFPLNTTFFAFSGFNNVIPPYSDRTDTGNVPADPFYSLKEVRDITTRICSMSYNDFWAKYTNVSEQFRDRGCPSLVYFVGLLSAYKFPDTTRALYIAEDIDGTELSWTLGRMVYEVNMLDYERIAQKLPSRFTYFVVFGILTFALFVTLALLINTWSKVSKLNKSGSSINTDDDNKYISF